MASAAKNTLFVLPAFALHFVVVAVPVGSLAYFSMTDWNGLAAPSFVGLENFKRMLFEDSNFKRALINNVIYMFVFLTVPIAFGLLMAMLTVQTGRMRVFYQALFFAPYVISPAIAGKVFMLFYDPYHGIGQFFDAVGLDFLANIQYIGNRNLTLFSIAAVDVWHWWGFVLVIFVAALQQVDPNLYEAAELDGANRLQKFIHVTIPQIRPTLVTLMTVTIVGSFVTFDYVYVMTQGGPAGASEMASTWIYKRAFNSYEAGYASALSIVVCGGCVIAYLGFQQLRTAK